MRIAGSSVLITGGAHGLGRRFALDLAAAGARVGVCDLDEEGLRAVAKEALRAGSSLWSKRADVTDEVSVEALFAEFVAYHQGLDAAVNNAGIARDGLLVKQRGGRLEKLPLADWQRVIDVDLTGVFLCGREAAYHMVQHGSGGVIVSLSSVARGGVYGQTSYSAAKAGVAAMTVTWAKELARYGVRAVALAPGFTTTELTSALRVDVRERIVTQIPLGRVAEPAEQSSALRFVLENDYLTGRVIEVDGGLRV
ncbi:MAG: SDR family oxidoreductase [Thermoleophilia bacterium]|nr:SDR family oxidoreductase [Thermoleophilia bacterium]